MWDLTIHPFQGPTSSLALVPLPNRHGISQSTPFKAQRPRWLSFLSPIDVRSHNPLPSGPNVLTGSCSSLQSTWYLTIHPSRPNVLTASHSSPQSTWYLTIHPLHEPTSSLTLVPLHNHTHASTHFQSSKSLKNAIKFKKQATQFIRLIQTKL